MKRSFCSTPAASVRSRRARTCLVIGLSLAAGAAAGAAATQYAVASGPVFESPGGARLEVLLDRASLGAAEVEIGEITFPVGSDSGMHPHGSTEIFYVLEGVLEHTVNGTATELRPGMVGFVRPPDQVRHRTIGNEPARALVIWVPGGEAARVTGNWRQVSGGD